MTALLDRLEPDLRERLTSAPIPDTVDPMLAVLSHEPFSDPGWVFERKLDGERCLALRDGERTELRSRTGEDLAPTYPELAPPLGDAEAGRFVVDGEVVAFSGGRTSFQRLQGRMQLNDPDEARASDISVFYYLFDLLHLDGRDLTRLPLRARKGLLRRLLTFEDPIRYTPHRNADGEEYLAEACAKGWEGLIAKDASSPYVHGRSRQWRKLKCVHRQELVVGGFTEPEGSRVGFGALLVGFYEDDDLVYAGKVGTGFDDDTLRSLRDRLDDLERDDPPFAEGELPTVGVHWTAPELVAEIGFTEWTDDERLRHPRFLGLRRDKPATEVVKER